MPRRPLIELNSALPPKRGMGEREREITSVSGEIRVNILERHSPPPICFFRSIWKALEGLLKTSESLLGTGEATCSLSGPQKA